MKNIIILSLTIFTILFAVSCNTYSENIITQVSIIDALLAGAYDGQISCRDLISYGDFGIGTFDRLDGEMTVLDGKIYQVKSDGRVYCPEMNLTTPFACVVNFSGDITVKLDGPVTLEDFETIIDRAVLNKNIFCAVKVEGRFSKMKTRSVYAQEKPYPPLTKVTKNQPIFEFSDICGTIVGFRCPAYAKGINVPGYHLHFISSDKTAGGHILSFEIADAAAEIDFCNRFLLVLPQDNNFAELDLTSDRTAELQKAEK